MDLPAWLTRRRGRPTRTALASAPVKVWVDEQLLKPAAIGIEFVVDPGPHKAKLVRPGKPDVHAEVTVAPGEHAKVTLGEKVDAPPPSTKPPAKEPPHPARSVGPVLLLAGGGAVALTGLAFGAVALGKRAEACDGDLVCDPAGLQSGKTYARISTVVTSVGIALAAGGVVWLLLTPRSDVGIVGTVHVTPHSAAFAAGLRF